jgi:hypothetical protein
MSATTVGRVSLVGLTTIGVLVSQVNGAKALSLEPIYSSTNSVDLTSEVPVQLAGGSWKYSYDIAVKSTASKPLTSWILPLLGISDLESIEGEEVTSGQLSGIGWRLYDEGNPNYTSLWGNHSSKLAEKYGQTFSNSPWILAFTTAVYSGETRSFNFVSKNGPRTVPFIADIGSGYAYELGDPYAPRGSVPQAPTPFLGFGLAAIAAKTATRKRTV